MAHSHTVTRAFFPSQTTLYIYMTLCFLSVLNVVQYHDFTPENQNPERQLIQHYD